MYRIDNSTASSTMPAPLAPGAPGYFTTGSIGGELATIVSADFMNEVQEELIGILSAAGMLPDKTNNAQVVAAILALIANAYPRKVLTQATSFYVNSTTGNDNNNGLIAGTPWQTIQKAFNVLLETVDFAGQTVTVNLAPGTYAAAALHGTPLGCYSPNNLVLLGNNSNPSSVIVESTVPNGIAIDVAGGQLFCQGFTLVGAPSGQYGHCLQVHNSGNLFISNMVFGACPGGAHLVSDYAGNLSIQGSYSITGGAINHFQCINNAYLAGGGITTVVTLTGTPAFSQGFAFCSYNGTMGFIATTSFNGAATGQRYNVSRSAVIDTAEQGANYFPGSTAGNADATTYGVYL